MGWQLLARTPDRQIAGLLSGWSFKLSLRYNEVGSWSLNIPAEGTPAGWPAPGCGLIFIRDGKVWASGNLDDRDFSWSADPDDEAAGPGTYGLTGDTDLGRLAYRTIYPTPGADWEGAQGDYWTYGPDTAEEVMRVTVNWQAGSLARPARRVPGLRLGTPTGAGSQVRISERFTPLLDGLRKVALAGGGLAFDVRDALDGNLDFTVRPTADRTDTARFGRELGNVVSLNVLQAAPNATVALIAAQGEKEQRELVEIADPDADPAWGRRELFIDQRDVSSDQTDTDRMAEYDKAAAEAFATDGEQTAVSAVIRDTPVVQLGRDYDLGDRVSVLTPFGPVADLVRQVDVEVDATGVEEITSVIGTTDPTTTDPMAATQRAMDKRISRLERSL